MPCEPPVSERRLNASCCATKSSVIVTIANVAARVRYATQPTGIEPIATPIPISGRK